MSQWAAVETGEAGKEAPTGWDASQPCLEGYWGTSGMALMLRNSRALALTGFLPTATPEQPGVKDRIYREVWSWNSCRSFVGAMLGPMGLFVGSNAQPWGAGFLGDACPRGAGFRGDAQGPLLVCTIHRKNANFFLTPKISPASKPRHLCVSVSCTSPPGQQLEEQSSLVPIPAASTRLRCCPCGGARQRRRVQAPTAPACRGSSSSSRTFRFPQSRRSHAGLGWAGLGRAAASPARAGLGA